MLRRVIVLDIAHFPFEYAVCVEYA